MDPYEDVVMTSCTKKDVMHNNSTETITKPAPKWSSKSWDHKTSQQQDSPPAWTQEAYRPQRGKHTLCYPRWGGGVPTLVGGVPTLGGGGTYLVGGYLLWWGGYLL